MYEGDVRKYDGYIPQRMMSASNDFYNFIMDSALVFEKEDSVSLKTAWEMYKTFCEQTGVQYPSSRRAIKEELRDYFRNYIERGVLEDGTRVRNYYYGFRKEKIGEIEEEIKEETKKIESWLAFGEKHSLLDDILADCPAQYASGEGTPLRKWQNVKTKLKDLDSSRLHYVKVPENHIVVDFDIPGKDGKKDFEANLAAASKFPKTYAELSKSGAGIHLHYIYSGDVSKLSRIYEEHIEVKVFNGNASLRRMLSQCNDIPIATINAGLPLKGETPVKNVKEIKSEKALRIMIARNLNKEYHGYTKPSIDFIWQILEDAYASDLRYDVTDMRNAVLGFAAGSHNNADYCIRKVGTMHFKSKEKEVELDENGEAPIVFFDVEVFPNLFLVCWKLAGEDKPVIKMVNPGPREIEELLRYRLVGFNCKKYDNHMLYGCLIGFNNEQLYKLSQSIINDKQGFFGEAYNLSYTDIYDFASTKQSLKKFEIELGIHHQELGLPWDQPVPEDLWDKVADYCENDVRATEAVFNARKGDFLTREILATINNTNVNESTNNLTTKMIFGNNKHPKLVYTDLKTGETE